MPVRSSPYFRRICCLALLLSISITAANAQSKSSALDADLKQMMSLFEGEFDNFAQVRGEKPVDPQTGRDERLPVEIFAGRLFEIRAGQSGRDVELSKDQSQVVRMKKEKNLSRRKLISASAQVAAGAAAASLLPNRAAAQGKSKPKGSPRNPPSARFSNPATLSKPRGYSHVAEVINGRVVYIAGQVSLDKDGNLVGKDDFRAQCTQVFENLKAALESVGANFTHVVKLNNYFLDMSNLAAFREIRDKYVNVQSPPASTAVEVRKLAREEWLVEIEAVAIIPEREKAK